MLYIDQPVGTGFASGNDPATTNAIATQDFLDWLKAFYDVFPGLLSQNTHLMGESYAGIYVSLRAPEPWNGMLGSKDYPRMDLVDLFKPPS